MRVTYIRVSTDEQQTTRQEVMMQELNVQKIFIEKISGKDTNRPELQKMLDFLREGDTLVVESISRLARNTKDLLSIIELLEEQGIAFVSVKESIDTTTPTGKFMLTVFGAMAELERTTLLQRQSEGIACMPINPTTGKKCSARTGRDTGRPTLVKPANFDVTVDRVTAGEVTATEAMKILGLKRTSYYKLLKEYK